MSRRPSSPSFTARGFPKASRPKLGAAASPFPLPPGWIRVCTAQSQAEGPYPEPTAPSTTVPYQRTLALSQPAWGVGSYLLIRCGSRAEALQVLGIPFAGPEMPMVVQHHGPGIDYAIPSLSSLAYLAPASSARRTLRLYCTVPTGKKLHVRLRDTTLGQLHPSATPR